MRRMLASALVLGIFSTVGLIGCGEEAAVTKETTVSTPGGTTTTTTEKKVETTGANPPPAGGHDPGHHALSRSIQPRPPLTRGAFSSVLSLHQCERKLKACRWHCDCT